MCSAGARAADGRRRQSCPRCLHGCRPERDCRPDLQRRPRPHRLRVTGPVPSLRRRQVLPATAMVYTSGDLPRCRRLPHSHGRRGPLERGRARGHLHLHRSSTLMTSHYNVHSTHRSHGGHRDRRVQTDRNRSRSKTDPETPPGPAAAAQLMTRSTCQNTPEVEVGHDPAACPTPAGTKYRAHRRPAVSRRSTTP
jgi:hypothetical protein